jgi:hypothetical protein
MNTEGKITNQTPRFRFNSGDPKPTCSKCNTLIERPTTQTLFIKDNFNQKHNFAIYHYVKRPHFIYESKSGCAVVYCSEYCRNKHNHRFNSVKKMKIYIVKNTYGDYDTAHTSIDKIFDASSKAQSYIQEVLSRIYELKQLFNKMSDTGHDENDDIYDKALVQFEIDFPDTYYDSWEGNTFQIVERSVE